MTKQLATKRKVGQPSLGLPVRKRRNLNIERDERFDANLFKAQQIIAGHRGLPTSAISQREAVYRAIQFYIDCMTEMKKNDK